MSDEEWFKETPQGQALEKLMREENLIEAVKPHQYVNSRPPVAVAVVVVEARNLSLLTPLFPSYASLALFHQVQDKKSHHAGGVFGAVA